MADMITCGGERGRRRAAELGRLSAPLDIYARALWQSRGRTRSGAGTRVRPAGRRRRRMTIAMATSSPTRSSRPRPRPGRAALAIVRLSGPAAPMSAARLTGRPPPPPRRAALRAAARSRDRRAARSGPGALVPGARPASPARTCSSCRSTAAARCSPGCWTALAGLPGSAAGRARRVHAARVPERAARSDRGRGPGRSDRRPRPGRRRARRCASSMASSAGSTDRWRQTPAERRSPGSRRRSTSRPRRRTCPRICSRRVGPERRAPVCRNRGASGRRRARRAPARGPDGRGASGRPNAGKSSLVNRLARRDVAIVTRAARDHPRRARGPPRPRRLSGHAARHRRPARGGRRGRGRGRAAGARARRARRSAAAACSMARRWPELDPATLALVDDDRAGRRQQVPTSARAAGSARGRRAPPALPLSCLTGQGVATVCSMRC